MQLDRNINRGGRGKYALVNMRKLIPLIDAAEADPIMRAGKESYQLVDAFNLLVREGIISLGNETPGDQFFVMKYKDQFTAAGLTAYAKEVCMEAARRAGQPEFQSLLEYGQQMVFEANAAKELGNRIPD